MPLGASLSLSTACNGEMALFIIATVAVIGILWLAARSYLSPSPVDNVPGPHASFIKGHIPDIMKRQNWEFWKHIADTYGPISRLSGPLGMRIVVVYDPKAMHHILIKDMDSYPRRITPTDEFHLLLGPGLLNIEGDQHRKQRKLLNPVFSAAHLHDMTHIFYNVAHRLRDAIGERVGKGPTTVDVNGWMGRTTLEMLGQAGLGYSFDDFAKNFIDEFGESLKNFVPMFSRVPLLSVVVPTLSRVVPERLLIPFLRMLPIPKLRYLLDISKTMESRSREIFLEKKKALQMGDEELTHRVGEGKDIMSILLKDNISASKAEMLTEEELVAQMSIFILAGMDTTSNALSRILHLLALHPEVQDKLRAEILDAQAVNGNTDIGYDDILKLPYLDAVCRETLRLFPPVAIAARKVGQDVLLPLSEAVRGRDGRMMSEVALPRGTTVFLNLQLSNCNKVLWGDDAYEWRPERWLEPLPSAVEEARIPGVYSNLMTFLGGPRSCIGFKFSQLEMKVVLSTLLCAYAFEMTDEPIVWNSGPVMYPTMGEESDQSGLLLKVRAL